METNAPAKPTTRDVRMRGPFMLILVIGFAVGQWLLNISHLVYARRAGRRVGRRRHRGAACR